MHTILGAEQSDWEAPPLQALEEGPLVVEVGGCSAARSERRSLGEFWFYRGSKLLTIAEEGRWCLLGRGRRDRNLEVKADDTRKLLETWP